MNYFWTALLGIIALIWVVQSARALIGMLRVPRLGDVPPLPDEACPHVSLLFAARDEEKKLPTALPTFLAQDYPHLEVIAVDDRSTDATGRILDHAAREDARLKVLHIRELPPGWLGKPHALQQAYEQSSGEWLLFTDADIRFAPDLLRRALALALERGWDHLTLVGRLDMRGFWETTATIFFSVGFLFGVEVWRVSNPRSKRYMGVGSFQLIRRSAYQALGTHRRLAMEVVDDMKLGKLVKVNGFRSGVGRAEGRIRLRWNEGLGETVRAVSKNFFAVCDYSVLRVLRDVAGLLVLSVVPFVAVFLTSGPAQWLAGVAAGIAVGVQAVTSYQSRISVLYAFTYPLGALIFCYMLVNSMVVTLRQGGVVWRGTFYPLAELRKGMV